MEQESTQKDNHISESLLRRSDHNYMAFAFATINVFDTEKKNHDKGPFLFNIFTYAQITLKQLFIVIRITSTLIDYALGKKTWLNND